MDLLAYANVLNEVPTFWQGLHLHAQGQTPASSVLL